MHSWNLLGFGRHPRPVAVHLQLGQLPQIRPTRDEAVLESYLRGNPGTLGVTVLSGTRTQA